MRRVIPLLLVLASCGTKPIVSNAGSYPAAFGTYTRTTAPFTVQCTGQTATLSFGSDSLNVVQEDANLTVGVLSGTIDMEGNVTLSSGSADALSGTYANGSSVSGPVTETGTFDTSSATKQFDLVLSWHSDDGNCTGIMQPDTWTAQ